MGLRDSRRVWLGRTPGSLVALRLVICVFLQDQELGCPYPRYCQEGQIKSLLSGSRPLWEVSFAYYMHIIHILYAYVKTCILPLNGVYSISHSWVCSLCLSSSFNLFVLIFFFLSQNRPKVQIVIPSFPYVTLSRLLRLSEPYSPHLQMGFKRYLLIIMKTGEDGSKCLGWSPTLNECSSNGSCFYYCICKNKIPPYSWKGQSPFWLLLPWWLWTVPLNASVPQGTVWDSSLSTVISLLSSAFQTPLNKLFQFSAHLLPMKEAMWSHYLLTKGIPGLNWAPNLMLVLLYLQHLLILGCVLLQAILYCLLFPSHFLPPTSAAIIS